MGLPDIATVSSRTLPGSGGNLVHGREGASSGPLHVTGSGRLALCSIRWEERAEITDLATHGPRRNPAPLIGAQPRP
jgi:hypothetical protein